ncbi:Gfo/Idh/MocA family oxidoreductase [bacterium]|nr:Gfo/Idh/MocA family oxidoreductase [bacterium]
MSENEKKDNKKGSTLSRRNFLGAASTAAAAFTIVPRHVLGGAGYQAPSDMVNVAGIGVGARGLDDIRGIADEDVPIVRPMRTNTGQPYSPEEIAAREARNAQRAAERAAQPQQSGQQQQVQQQQRPPKKLANIYALCDVDLDFAAYVFAGYPKAKVYQDFRKMLDNEKEIDAVTIATPDHTHAVIAAYAMRMGKHVYVEKPMCKTVYETRRLREIAQEMNVVTQMGNQGHATEAERITVEWIRDGAIGLVREVHLSTNRPIWPQGDIPRPPGVPVPKTLDWDIWLGPAPVKPYNPDLCHFVWRGLRDYGTGAMGDMGAHIFDAPIWSLNLGLPTKIQASSTPFNDEYWPIGEMVTYEFPARGYQPSVKITWVDGGLKQVRPPELADGLRMQDDLYIGDKGVLIHSAGDSGNPSPRLIPESAMQAYELPEKWLPRTGDIYEDWIDAIKNGKKSCNDFKIAGHLTEIMLLTNVAVLTARYNTTLEYDGENMQFTNLPEANEFLHYEYRKGWTL